MTPSQGFWEQGKKGIHFMGTGEQRQNFEGNRGTKTILGNREHKKTNFRLLGNRGTNQFISEHISLDSHQSVNIFNLIVYLYESLISCAFSLAFNHGFNINAASMTLNRQVAKICILAPGGLNFNERLYCCKQSVVPAGQPLGRCNFV